MLYTYAIILFAFISFIYVERKNLCAPIYLSGYLPTILYISIDMSQNLCLPIYLSADYTIYL